MDGILYRIPPPFKAFVGVLIFCMVAFGLCPTGFSAPASTEKSAELSAREKQDLVQQGVEQYKQGNRDQAQKNLETARTVFPDNYAVPYYLGLIYLEQGKRSAAIAQWRQYVEMDPESENASRIRKNLTMLLREEAQDSAREAVANEAALTSSPAAGNTVAISAFNNLGSENIKPLGKGMAALLIHDLSQVPDLQVVERIRLQALLKEMNLGTSGLVSAETAPRVGKLLKAKHVTSGSLADLEQESLQIASAVVDADRMASIGTQEAQGRLKQFYDLEKQIACQIIEDLGKNCDQVPAEFSKIHTKSMPALVSYSWGLEYFDEGKYDEARTMFQKALDEDPQFELAAAALLATPTTTMMSMSRAQMISSASSSGPSSAVAGTAVATTSPAITVPAATVATSTVGFPATTAIIGGAALVGGGVALAGGGGGDGGAPASAPPAPTSLTGDWTGPWTDAGGAGGEATLSLTQTDNAVSGTVSVTGYDECLTEGNVSGTVSDNTVHLTIRSDGTETVEVNGTVDFSDLSINGTWDYTESGSVDCQDDTGTFSATLTTGSVRIHW
ncbi:MAG: tetratricopeptide repeat protein [Desulfobacteraceae bacterium]